MLLTQQSLLEIVGQTKKGFGEFKKSLLPAVQRRLRDFKERQDKRKGENTKKEKKDYVPPPIMVKDEPKEDLLVKRPVKKPVQPPEQFKLPEIGAGYKLPPTELLDPPDGEQFKIDKETLHATPLFCKRSSRILALKAKSSRCALVRSSPCTSSSPRQASRCAAS
jgi:hypothetical protein